MTDIFSNDYNTKKLETVHMDGFKMFITPRYIDHYVIEEYESFSARIVKRLIREDRVFVDIGAHYGFYSLVAGSSKNNVEIIAVEPIKENCAIIKKNFEENRFRNYSIHCNAASDAESLVEFNQANASDSSSFYQHPLAKLLKKIKVKTVVPDNLLKNKKNIQVIKIDVEGHEIPVLRGLKNTLSKNKEAVLLIEFNLEAQRLAGFKNNQMLSILDHLGFYIYFVNEGLNILNLYRKNQPWKSFLKTNSQFEKFGYCNLLCVREKLTDEEISNLEAVHKDEAYNEQFALSNHRLLSYAQNGEDVILNRCFRDINHGTYIDVGAADPIINSVTNHFYQKGWNGVNVEPTSHFFSRLKKQRRKDINLNMVVGQTEIEIPFYESTSVLEWSTFSKEMMELHLKNGARFIEHKIQSITLSSIFSKYINSVVNFLKIDVEGAEAEVLKSNDWKKYRPRIVLVENTDPEKWEVILLDANYLFGVDDGLNRYYVRQEDNELLKHLRVAANVRDNFEPFYYHHIIEELNQKNEELSHQFTALQHQLALNTYHLEVIRKSKFYKLWRKFNSFKDLVIGKQYD